MKNINESFVRKLETLITEGKSLQINLQSAINSSASIKYNMITASTLFESGKNDIKDR